MAAKTGSSIEPSCVTGMQTAVAVSAGKALTWKCRATSCIKSGRGQGWILLARPGHIRSPCSASCQCDMTRCCSMPSACEMTSRHLHTWTDIVNSEFERCRGYQSNEMCAKRPAIELPPALVTSITRASSCRAIAHNVTALSVTAGRLPVTAINFVLLCMRRKSVPDCMNCNANRRHDNGRSSQLLKIDKRSWYCSGQ